MFSLLPHLALLASLACLLADAHVGQKSNETTHVQVTCSLGGAASTKGLC